MTVEVVPYSHDWPQLFSRVAEQLREAFDGLPTIEIEHVGSTAVPGLAAKPILDVDALFVARWWATLSVLWRRLDTSTAATSV